MRPWALVTGASSGIGLELARLAAADGHDLVLVARGAEALASVAASLRSGHGCTVLVLPLDLAAAGAPDALADDLARRGIVPAFFANNAGVGAWGRHQDLAVATEQAILDLNVVAATRLLKRLLPGMLARGAGRILNVASSAAFQAGPWMAVYYASKAYLLHYSEALAEELAGTGVTVTALCPGPTPTGFQAAAGLRASRTLRGLVPATDAAWVARVGYEAARRGRRVVVPGIVNRLLAQALRLAPRRLANAIAARANRPG
jgi:short-subunit dehydrogenase